VGRRRNHGFCHILPYFGCACRPGRAWPGAGDRGRIERFELQLSEYEAGAVAWPFPLAWVLGESALNSCLWGGTQAKAILVLYLLEVAGVLLHMF